VRSLLGSDAVRSGALLLPLALSGCFLSHERGPGRDGGTSRDGGRRVDAPPLPGPDAPPALDGGPSECSIDPGVVVGLDCPESAPRGERITVTVRTHMLGCCAVSAPAGTTARSIGPDTWEIDAPYSVCRCCEMCLCEPVVGTRTITLEPPSGSTLRVVARDLGCETRIEGPTSCRTLRADDWMAPHHVAVGEPIPVRVVHAGGVSCGCSPRAELATPGGPELSFLACDCSDVDPCVDGGYEATAIATGASAPGMAQFHHPYPGGRVGVEVHDRADCVDDLFILVDSLALAAPDPRFIAEDPRATWIELRGHQRRCCGEPALLVDHSPAGGGPTLVLSRLDCNPDLCDCAIGHRVDFVEHHFLGSLPPGTTRVVAGSHRLDILVP
jgi:hypothetical protein